MRFFLNETEYFEKQKKAAKIKKNKAQSFELSWKI